MHGYGGSHKMSGSDYGSHGSHDGRAKRKMYKGYTGKKPKEIREAVKRTSGVRLKKSFGGERYEPRAQGTTARVTKKTEGYVSVKPSRGAKIGERAMGSEATTKKQFTQLRSKSQVSRLRKSGKLMEYKKTTMMPKGGAKRAKPYGR